MKENTSIEEARELVQLGINVELADMYYKKSGASFVLTEIPSPSKYSDVANASDVPCWSIGNIQQLYDICFIDDSVDKYERMFSDDVIELFVEDCRNNKFNFSILDNE